MKLNFICRICLLHYSSFKQVYQGWALISTRPLPQASLLSVERAQIIDHSPVWRVWFSLPRNNLNCKINTACFLHYILPRKSLNINLPFLFYKVLYSELSNKLVLKGNIWLHKIIAFFIEVIILSLPQLLDDLASGLFCCTFPAPWLRRALPVSLKME